MVGLTFDQQLEQAGTSVAKEYNPDSSTLLVTFGGIRGRAGITPFEFFHLTKDISINRLFVRDLRQSWYHAGLEKISSNIESTNVYLQQEIERLKPSKVIMVGNSAGGFAAILFGFSLNVDYVLAFSPQTFMKPSTRFENLDFRWPVESFRLYSHLLWRKSSLDLKSFIDGFSGKTECHIYFGKKHRLDKLHAQYLAKFPFVYLHPYASQEHSIVRAMKESGELRALLLHYLLEKS